MYYIVERRAEYGTSVRMRKVLDLLYFIGEIYQELLNKLRLKPSKNFSMSKVIMAGLVECLL